MIVFPTQTHPDNSAAKPRAPEGVGLARVRDTVHGQPIQIVLGAFSETIPAEQNRLLRAQRISAHASLRGASHCLLAGDVAYFSDTGGLSLAAQIEADTGACRADTEPTLVCIAFDSMVYLCRHADSLVTEERMLIAERAEQVLSAVREPVRVFAVGTLGERFLRYGEARDSAALQLSNSWRNPYCFMKTGICLLRYGMPLPRHAAQLFCLVAAMVAFGFFEFRFSDVKNPVPTAQKIIAPMLPASLPADAAEILQWLNFQASALRPAVQRLGIRELAFENGRLSAFLGGQILFETADFAQHFGFQQSSSADGRLSWHSSLPPLRQERKLPDIQELHDCLSAVRRIPGVQLSELQQRNLPVLQLTEVRLQIRGAAPFALERLRLLLEPLPARLLSARLRYDTTGLLHAADLSVSIRSIAV